MNSINTVNTQDNNLYKFQSIGCDYKSLKYILRISLALIIITMIMLFAKPYIPYYSDWSNEYAPLNLWFHLADFVTQYFNPALSTIVGLCVSAIILFIKGETKHYYLQLNTFYQSVNKVIKHGIEQLVLLFGISFVLQVYASKESRSSAATLATASMLLLMCCIILYIIRYNNQSRYLREAQYHVISSNIDNEEDYEKYLELLFPIAPEKYNDIDNDISILKLLISNSNFLLENNSALESTVNENEIVFSYFKKLVIPYVVHMTRTYNKSRHDLIIALQKHLAVEFSDNGLFNKTLRYFIMVVSRQYLIDTEYDIQQNNNLENDKTSIDIHNWLNKTEKEFLDIYGIKDHIKFQDYNENSIFYELYAEYISQLHSRNLMQINAYCRKEQIYMLSRKQLTPNMMYPSHRITNAEFEYNFDFNPLQIVFINIIP